VFKSIFIAAVMFFVGLNSAYAGKIGFIDMQKAVEMTKKGKKSIKKLKGIQVKKQKELDAKKKSLEKEQKEISKKFAVYSKEKQMQVQQEFQQKAMAADKYFRESQVELANKEKDLLEPVLEGLRESIAVYARANGFDIILEKNRLNLNLKICPYTLLCLKENSCDKLFN